jgi:hypothetical protein
MLVRPSRSGAGCSRGDQYTASVRHVAGAIGRLVEGRAAAPRRPSTEGRDGERDRDAVTPRWYQAFMGITREQLLRFRHHEQRLAGDGPRGDAPILDLGVQDTGGPKAARWALALRGCEPDDTDLVYAWTMRGAPHAYRRHEIAQVAAATAPYDEADAAKRIFDAARPLKQAGIPVVDALEHLAGHMRDIVAAPTVKGEVSTVLTVRLPAAYLRECRPCDAVHTYEQPFRLAALQAGLELVPDTSPPVLRRIDRWEGAATSVPDHLDPIRAVLHLLGPATPTLVAGYLDAPVRTVRRRWPQDTVVVMLDGASREVLTADDDALRDPPPTDGVRLLGAFDPWLQARDRELLVADAPRRKALWPTLGRPGAVLAGHEVVGTWRPRSSGATLQLLVEIWDGGELPAGIDDQAERLATHRGQRFGGYADH